MAVRRARKQFGVSLHLGSVESLPGNDLYDAAVLWDVIEHCPRPDEVLEAVCSRLRVGGKVLLTTGNFESEDRVQSGKNWWCWQTEHYHYFSPPGIQRLGNSMGLGEFRVDRVPRIHAPLDNRNVAVVPTKSRLRHLNPFHVARALAWNYRHLYSRWRWPNHYDIGIMLCVMTRVR